MFSCEICEIFKNTYFEEHLRTAFTNVFVLMNVIHSRFKSQLFGLDVFLRFIGRKFLVNLRQKFHVRKSFFCVRKIFLNPRFCGICSLFHLFLKLLFRKWVPVLKLAYWRVFNIVLVNGTVFNRSNGLMIKCFNSMFDELK